MTDNTKMRKKWHGLTEESVTIFGASCLRHADPEIAKAFLNRFLKMGAPGGQKGQAAIIQNAIESLGSPNADV
ncbi:unnamed protein product [Strongylus vulgaris]|uniref:Uncharacterized protein n=1 Tax=Strongylus vulgaris TaxID=40348 RepID=A0A3P7J540_STRVU|nr:unnamed protein product [Strongylus vulgaris]